MCVNVKAIAQICGCKAHQANQFLNKLKDTVVGVTQSKKRPVSLNFLIGQLVIQPNLTVEFKNAGSNENGISLTETAKVRDNSFRASMQNSTKNMLSTLYKDKSEKKDYAHLSEFLQNQIYRGTGNLVKSQKKLEAAGATENDAFSIISKKNKFNN